jgi:hypothetical protein
VKNWVTASAIVGTSGFTTPIVPDASPTSLFELRRGLSEALRAKADTATARQARGRRKQRR